MFLLCKKQIIFTCKYSLFNTTKMWTLQGVSGKLVQLKKNKPESLQTKIHGGVSVAILEGAGCVRTQDAGLHSPFVISLDEKRLNPNRVTDTRAILGRAEASWCLMAHL